MVSESAPSGPPNAEQNTEDPVERQSDRVTARSAPEEVGMVLDPNERWRYSPDEWKRMQELFGRRRT